MTKSRIGQGKDNAREYLREHPDLSAEIELLVRQKLGVNSPSALTGSGEGED